MLSLVQCFADRKEPPRLDITYAYGVEKLTSEEKEARHPPAAVHVDLTPCSLSHSHTALFSVSVHTSGIPPVQAAADGGVQKTWKAEIG